jgi:hypothetical protein
VLGALWWFLVLRRRATQPVEPGTSGAEVKQGAH